MRGLKIIPLFLILIIFSYVGVIFVQNNPDEMVIRFFGDVETPPLALGFIILTSALVGMLVAGVLCVLELVVLYLQNKSLKRKLEELGHSSRTTLTDVISDTVGQAPASDGSDLTGDTEDGYYTTPDDAAPPPPPPGVDSIAADEDEESTRTAIEIKTPKEF